MLCGSVLFIWFVLSVLLGVNCKQEDNPRKMSWHYYDETDYGQLSNLNLTPQQKSLLNYDSEADMCCDDEEITPELTSTQDEYVTSTAAELRTTQVSQCPKSKSLISVNDLQRMILYVVNTTHVEGQIYDYIHATAETLVEKYITKLNSVLGWYTDRPTHFKYILQYIDQTHNELPGNIDKLSLSISYVKKQEEYYSLLDKNVKSVKDEFKKSKLLCSVCRDSGKLQDLKLSQGLSQDTQYKYKEYFCANLGTVYKIIKHSMTEFKKCTIEAITLQIQDDDLHFAYKISELSKKIKNFALMEFGTTMYNILGLWDNYLHYNEIIEQISDANLNNFENQLLTIGTELPNLKRNIRRLKEFCIKKCSLKPEHVFVKQLLASSVETLPLTNPKLENSSSAPTWTLQNLKDVLDELLKEMQEDIREKIRYNYLETFASLNDKLNTDDSEMVNNYLPNLEEIENEIHGLAENTIEKLNKLRIVTPEKHMRKIKNLAQFCNALQQDVQNMKTELNEMYTKIKDSTFSYIYRSTTTNTKY